MHLASTTALKCNELSRSLVNLIIYKQGGVLVQHSQERKNKQDTCSSCTTFLAFPTAAIVQCLAEDICANKWLSFRIIILNKFSIEYLALFVCHLGSKIHQRRNHQ